MPTRRLGQRQDDLNPDTRAALLGPQLRTLVHPRADWAWRMIVRHGCREWEGSGPAAIEWPGQIADILQMLISQHTIVDQQGVPICISIELGAR